MSAVWQSGRPLGGERGARLEQADMLKHFNIPRHPFKRAPLPSRPKAPSSLGGVSSPHPRQASSRTGGPTG